MTLVYANVMWACVCVTVSVYVVVVWQGSMEEQFLYWMDFTLYKYIWNKRIKKWRNLWFETPLCPLLRLRNGNL